MIGKKQLKEMVYALLEDEMLSRLLYFGEDPLDENKVLPKKEVIEKTIFNYQPSDDKTNKVNNVVINIFKSITKIKFRTDVTRIENVHLMIFVPSPINNNDLRIYDIEERISQILDKRPISNGISNLEYVDGKFTFTPAVTGYVQFNMTFETSSSRSVF